MEKPADFLDFVKAIDKESLPLLLGTPKGFAYKIKKQPFWLYIQITHLNFVSSLFLNMKIL